MNVNLSPMLEAMGKAKVASGLYTSARAASHGVV